MADIGVERLRALRETVAAFTGEAMVERQTMLSIIDAALRVDDPSKDDTEDAHPAWWRGYNANKGELALMADESNARAVRASALVSLLEAERDEARIMLRSATARMAGRRVPPTDAEIAAHEADGGRWRCVVPQSLAMSADAMHGRAAQLHRDTVAAAGHESLWWALDRLAGVTVWPMVKNNQSTEVER